MAYHVVGVDLGGTTFTVAAVDCNGSVMVEITLPTEAQAGAPAIIERIGDAIADVSEQARAADGGSCRGIGLGVPGLLDHEAGVCLYASNLQWREVQVVAPLVARFNVPVAMENDVRCAALGEYYFGAGRGVRDMALVTLGTGLGGALISEGSVVRGSGFAGEIGHQTINTDGPLCSCGNSGCLEAYVGTAGILSRARAYYVRDGVSIPHSVKEAAGDNLAALTPHHVCMAAEKADETALAVWADVGRYLGVGIANVINLLHPQRIVVGGGVARAWQFFSPAMFAEVTRRTPAVTAAGTELVLAQLGSAAGVVGAATLGQEAYTAGVK